MPEALAPPEDDGWAAEVVPDAELFAGEVADDGVVAGAEVVAGAGVVAGAEVLAGDDVGLPVAVDELDEPEPQAASSTAINAITRPHTSGRRVDLSVPSLIAPILSVRVAHRSDLARSPRHVRAKVNRGGDTAPRLRGQTVPR
ncbi:MAG: hypothetical protein ACR2IP_14100 [Solirubrobacteraceae bacterium]